MESIVRTVYGAELQTTQLLNLPLILKQYSTLNEKFSIHNDVAIADTDQPSVKYVTIGNGGHRMVMGASNISRPEPVQHTARDAALYNHLPFVLRLPNDDLTALERTKYRLRRLETHDGTVYVAYYLKVLDLSATVPQLELRTVADGVTTSTDFSPTIADLNPTPPALNPGGVLITTGDYIAATAKVPFILSTSDIDELLNVCNIIYSDDNYAMISEIGLCSGVDRAVVGDFNGVSTGYTDAIGVQIVSFINAFFAVKFSNNGVNILFDIGNSEPLLNIS
jgi:hypothetical protein